jgi:hypothetical protein
MITLNVQHPSELSDSRREFIRRRSKTLFGSSDRLEVAVAVALSSDGVVNATDLQWELRLAANRVRAQLLALSDAGVLVEAPSGLSRKRMFVRGPSAFWGFCLELYSDLIA